MGAVNPELRIKGDWPLTCSSAVAAEHTADLVKVSHWFYSRMESYLLPTSTGLFL